MSRSVVFRATVIRVGLLAVASLLELPLARDGIAAEVALDEFATVGHLVRAIEVLAQEFLNTVPSGSIDQRRKDKPPAAAFRETIRRDREARRCRAPGCG